MPDLDAVRHVAPFVVQFTVTGYPRALETSVIPSDDAVAQLRELRRRFGPRVAVWRYDPIVFADDLDAPAHLAGFAALARALSGTVDEVVLSVVHPYRKTRRNLDRAATRHGFAWRDPPLDEKRDLLRLSERSRASTASRRPCAASPSCWRQVSAKPAASTPNGWPMSGDARSTLAQDGNRPGCRCAASRDIGAYDTCPHGCVYCYAVTDRDRAVANFRRHDPEAARLLG